MLFSVFNIILFHCRSCRHKPGDVISVSEHPLDQGRILIAYSGGKCVLYDMRENNAGREQQLVHKRFNYDPGSDHVSHSYATLLLEPCFH